MGNHHHITHDNSVILWKKSRYDSFTSTYFVFFQISVSVNEIGLGDVTWLTSDVNMLMSGLSITYLECLVMGDKCKLISGLKHDLPSSPVKVDHVKIWVSLSINTLASLISHMEVNKLCFRAGCRVLGMDVNTTPPPKVSLNKFVFPVI